MEFLLQALDCDKSTEYASLLIVSQHFSIVIEELERELTIYCQVLKRLTTSS